jgi:hypothetical protein
MKRCPKWEGAAPIFRGKSNRGVRMAKDTRAGDSNAKINSLRKSTVASTGHPVRQRRCAILTPMASTASPTSFFSVLSKGSKSWSTPAEFAVSKDVKGKLTAYVGVGTPLSSATAAPHASTHKRWVDSIIDMPFLFGSIRAAFSQPGDNHGIVAVR